jgi:hypothetical protein
MGRKTKSTDRDGGTVAAQTREGGGDTAKPPESDVEERLKRLRDVRAAGTVELWPLERLVRHPKQYRTPDVDSRGFQDLLDSVKEVGPKGVGVLEPVIVRELVDGKEGWRKELGVVFGEVLSGQCRCLAATMAGQTHVPVRNLGRIPDEEAAKILAVTNNHIPLRPLEEGARLAMLMDVYHEDAKAVASSIGKSEHYVLTHTMIERNLIPGWKEESALRGGDICGRLDPGPRRNYATWTAAHWVHIAKLPAAIQEHWLAKIQKDYRFDPHDATADTVAKWLVTEKLFLAKALFDWAKVCAQCPKRTDAINQLLWTDPDVKGDEGTAVRCLDPKCWERQEARAVKVRFKEGAAAAVAELHAKNPKLNIPDPVPISMMEVPKDDWEHRKQRERYVEALRPIRKAFGQALVTADRITLAKEGDKRADPGIVVAGRGTGSLKWVKIKPKEQSAGGGRSGPRTPTAEELAEQERANRQAKFREIVARQFQEHMQGVAVPDADMVLFLTVFFEVDGPWGKDREKLIKAGLEAKRKYPEQPIKCVTEWMYREMMSHCYFAEDIQETLEAIGPLFGFDTKAEYAKAKSSLDKPAKEPPPEPKGKKPKTGKKWDPGVCRICGCTEEDCSECIMATGEPCTWADGTEAICTRCVCPVQAGTGPCISDGNCKACGRKSDQPIRVESKGTKRSTSKHQPSTIEIEAGAEAGEDPDDES